MSLLDLDWPKGLWLFGVQENSWCPGQSSERVGRGNNSWSEVVFFCAIIAFQFAV